VRFNAAGGGGEAVAPTLESAFFKDAFSLLGHLAMPNRWFRAGMPYFNSFFARDAFMSGIAVSRLDPSPLKAALEFGAKYQAPNGDIPHQHFENPADIPFGLKLFWGKPPYYEATDAAAWFVIGLAAYMRRTGDQELLDRLWPQAKLAISRYLDDADFAKYGFIPFRKKKFFGLTHQNWRDGYLNFFGLRKPIFALDIQCLVCEALTNMADLATVREFASASRFLVARNELAYRIRKRFRWRRENYVFSYLHGEDLEPFGAVMPDPATTLASGVWRERDAARILERISREDLWTPYGLRSLSASERHFVASPFGRRQFFLGPVWPHLLWQIWRGAAGFDGGDAIRVRLEECLLDLLFHFRMELARRGLSGGRLNWIFPEAVGVGVERPYDLEPLAGANLHQAWTAAAAIDMLYERVGEELHQLKFGE